MKSLFRFLGIIALAAVIGFTMTACDDGNNNNNNNNSNGGGGGGVSGGSLTINGLPSGSYEVRIFPSGTDISTITAVLAANNTYKFVAYGDNNTGGNVFTLKMNSEVWTGSGNFMVSLMSNNTTFTYYYTTVAISFSNGIGTAQYSSFTDCAVGGGLTITDLPSYQQWTVSIFPDGTDISTKAAVFDASTSRIDVAYGDIYGSDVFTLSSSLTAEHWTESGDFMVLLTGSSGGYNPPRFYATVSFSNGIGTVQYSSFTAVAD